MPSDARPHILVLGGTGEAADLARTIDARWGDAVRVTSSLAGRVEKPGPLPGDVRVGGFGGAEGIASFMREQGVDLLVDATHPFAEVISRNARIASEETGIPRLGLDRPHWARDLRDRWIEVETMEQAAATAAEISRSAFLTVGRMELQAFSVCRDVCFTVRLIAEPEEALPLTSYRVITGRGPFTVAEERELLAFHRIDLVITKASGGKATEAKILAAREADIPVLMIRRPRPEPGRRVYEVEEAVGWIAGELGL